MNLLTGASLLALVKSILKVFELLMEISEKSNTLNEVVKGNYSYNKWKPNSFLR